MENRFIKSAELAALLRIKPGTLRNLSYRHGIFRAFRKGIYPAAQVRIIETVWSGAISVDEGLACWNLEKERLRKAFK